MHTLKTLNTSKSYIQEHKRNKRKPTKRESHDIAQDLEGLTL